MAIPEPNRFNEVVVLLRNKFPDLHIELNRQDPHVDASLDIKKQPGLDFGLNINMQGDTLHLRTDKFWVEWFPCDEDLVFKGFVEAVVGLLSGDYRILHRYVGSIHISALLQKPVQAGWEKVATSSSGFGRLIPWPRRQVVVQNRQPSLPA
jgi:hypothetical protein